MGLLESAPAIGIGAGFAGTFGMWFVRDLIKDAPVGQDAFDRIREFEIASQVILFLSVVAFLWQWHDKLDRMNKLK